MPACRKISAKIFEETKIVYNGMTKDMHAMCKLVNVSKVQSR